MITAGFFLQLAGSVFGSDAFEVAFKRFSGESDSAKAADFVMNSRKPLTLNNALKIAASIGTPEAYAVGAFRTDGNKKAFKVGNYKDADVVAAARAIIEEATSRAQMPEPSAPAQQPASSWGSSLGSYFGGSSSSAAPAITAANVQAAVQAQQAADFALAAANNDMLGAIIKSGKSGVNLYTAFIDYIFSVLQQAVNSIADAGTQQQVLSYMQSKFATMKASVAQNNYQARMLGRMDSKKANKNSKNNKKSNSRK